MLSYKFLMQTPRKMSFQTISFHQQYLMGLRTQSKCVSFLERDLNLEPC